VISFLAVGFAVAVDQVQEVRAFDARAACRAQGLDPMRRPFSTDVACVRRAGYGTDSTVVRFQAGD
jgi:hypothetical protein